MIRRLLALVAAALLSVLVLAVPASAAQQVVTITDAGLDPAVLQIASGDTVVVRNDSGVFRRVAATSDNWELDSGLLGLAPGDSLESAPLTEPGTYTFTAGDGEAFAGSVVVPAPASPQPSPPPSDAGSGGASPAPAPPAADPAASPAPAEASPAPTGGTGTAGPPITGGFGSLGTLPSPAAEGVAPPPAIALPELPGEQVGPLPETAPEPQAAGGTDARPGRLASPVAARGYGLPAALGAVLVAGVVSLLVRLLLAEPSARRASRGGPLAGPAPVVTAD